jgi:hypothetical protein
VPNESPPRKRNAPPVAPPAPPDEESDRPTVNPPFDVEAFARAASSASPRRFSPDAPTERPPPPPPADVEASEARSQQITLTNEVELERARVQSAQRSDPPRRLSTSALSMADARAPSSAPAPAPPVSLSGGVTPPAGRSLSPTSIEAAVLGAIASSPGPEITERTIEDPIAEMRERFSLGDFTGALEMSELILAEDASSLEAAECGEACQRVLVEMYTAKLGPLERVPIVVVPRTQMRWLSIDHRAGFILSLIDGASSVDMILDVSGMPKLDALRILHELVQRKIVAFR